MDVKEKGAVNRPISVAGAVVVNRSIGMALVARIQGGLRCLGCSSELRVSGSYKRGSRRGCCYDLDGWRVTFTSQSETPLTAYATQDWAPTATRVKLLTPYRAIGGFIPGGIVH